MLNVKGLPQTMRLCLVVGREVEEEKNKFIVWRWRGKIKDKPPSVQNVIQYKWMDSKKKKKTSIQHKKAILLFEIMNT